MAADPLTRSTVDDLFNVDFSDFEDDPFADKPTTKDTRDDKAVLSPRSGLKRKPVDFDKENDGLGVDEEVKITKKRKPIAKLDEARLLSEPGIPKLRAISRSGKLSKKLRMKGKGHEFTDAARLLNHFQLWLDNLYPRAKFTDALQLVEKAGHTKRMHIMRTEWINEGKPGYRKYEDIPNKDIQQENPDLFGTTQPQKNADTGTSRDRAASAQPSASLPDDFDEDALFIPDANRPSEVDADDAPDDDELDALLAAQDEPNDHWTNPKQKAAEESEGEDDLDALLADQPVRQKPSPKSAHESSKSQIAATEVDEDELDALLAEQDAQDINANLPNTTQPSKPAESIIHHTLDDSDSDEDDLEALLALQGTRTKPTSDIPEPSLPTPQPTSSPARTPNSTPGHRNEKSPVKFIPAILSSSPIPNNPELMDLDDLDALLASQEAKADAAAAAAS